MKFNENLKYLRKQAGLTQEQLAEKLNVSRQAITKWESGQSLPDIENLKELSFMFSVSMDSLVGDIESKSTLKIKKKIDDIGYYILSLVVLLASSFFSIFRLIKHITENENIIVISVIIMIIMAFIIFVLLIKQYLINTREVIINMKPTKEGKKERIIFIVSNIAKIYMGLSILGIIREIDSLTQGVEVFIKEILSQMLVDFVICIIIGLVYYINLEKRVKELNCE